MARNILIHWSLAAWTRALPSVRQCTVTSSLLQDREADQLRDLIAQLSSDKACRRRRFDRCPNTMRHAKTATDQYGDIHVLVANAGHSASSDLANDNRRKAGNKIWI